MLARRPLTVHDHKYSRGVVAIIAGSQRFPGASLLTVGGARRGGAGYVKFLNSHQSITDTVISTYPDVVPITTVVNERIDALVVGPGATSIRKIPQGIPVLLDSGARELAKARKKGVSDRNQIIVLTPHEGELGALGFSLDKSIQSTKARDVNRIKVAQHIADALHVICVLKGHRTIIAAPQSTLLPSHEKKSARSHYIDAIGGPELATAGSGDVLAGLIGAFLASWQPKNHNEALEVVAGAVNLHSRAGKHAARTHKGVVATDILESLAHC